MGMFDYLRCEYPLPVEGRLPEGEANKLLFQTKDLDCMMDEITITKDGELVGQQYDVEDRSDPNAEGIERFIGCMTRVNIRPNPMPEFTGEVRFYTDYGPRNKNGCGGGWIEFSSYFRKGKLMSISLVEFREPTPQNQAELAKEPT